MTIKKRYGIVIVAKQAMLYLFCFTTTAAFSQKTIDVFGGITNNYLQTNYPERPFTQVISKSGFNMGATIQHELNRYAEIGSGMIALQKNYTIRRTGDYEGAYESFIRTYIQVPVFIRLKKEFKKIAVNLDAGPYGAWWISGKLKGNLPDIFATANNGNGETIPLRPYSETYGFSSEKDRRFEWGGLIATGASYRITKGCSVLINLAYYHALTGDQKNYSINLAQNYNRTISICVGTKFSLK
jgi:hypothetical protein